MQSRSFAIGHSPHCSLTQAFAAVRSFVTRTTSDAAESAGATLTSRPERSSSSGRTKPTRKHRSRHKRAARSIGYIRPFDQRAPTGRSSRRFIGPPSPEPFGRDSLILGYDTEEIEEAIEKHDWLTLYRTHEFVPPALTTNGGRTVMRRVCDEAEIALDGDHDYLTPHGGRRGAGDILYREDPVLAQLHSGTVRLKRRKTATRTSKQEKRRVAQVTFLMQIAIVSRRGPTPFWVSEFWDESQ